MQKLLDLINLITNQNNAEAIRSAFRDLIQVDSQAITAAGAISLTADDVTLSNAGATYAVTLAAPTVDLLGVRKTISMVAGNGTSTVTLALTNIVGGSAATSALFNAAGEVLMLEAIRTGASTFRWAVVKEIGVTLS